MKKNIKHKNSKAFSLLELLIVIVILGLLAGLVLPNLTGKAEQAKQKLSCTQMKIVYQSIKSFKLDNGRYPTTEEGLDALITSPDEELSNYPNGGYFDDGKKPKDAWNNTFYYIYDEDNGVELMSLGADNKEGGTGESTDIIMSKCK